MAYVQAKSEGKRSRRKMAHLQVSKADGGHVVEHHFESGMGEYHKPEMKIFSDGHEMLAHVGSKMGVGSEEEILKKLKGGEGHNEDEPGGDDSGEHGEENASSVPEEEFEEHEMRR